MEVKFEEDEDEFRSCCADEEELDREGIIKQGVKNDNDDDFLDINSARMFFKGVSVADTQNIGFNVSGIGVVMERVDNIPVIQVQKKLDFFVDESVADYLALMDGISEAARNNIKRVFAFTDSTTLFDQITTKETLENPLLMALKQRMLEHVENLEHFVLKCVPSFDLEEPLRLAQVAIGIVNLPIKGDSSVQTCLICCENKPTPMTINMKCSHKFCSCCIKAYVDEQVNSSSQLPIKCPSLNCRYYISTPELKSFLPVASYASLQDALSEPNMLARDKFYCPFSDCSVLLDPCCDSNQSDNNCVECPICRRFICVKCGVPWHSSMSCDQFQESPPQGRVNDGPLEIRKWKRCQMCERMIELTHGCYHMTCWCGHEFCYSCGSGYTDSEQTCGCVLSNNNGGENDDFTLTQNFGSSPALEAWAWDSCGSLSNLMDAYSDQERSQLALIQRFLAGGFSLGDHHTYPYQSQSPPPPCADSGSSYLENTMKDLHQLPWLERFVSVISDNYYEQYTE